MAVNPMQRKARTSFLLGMLLMTLIAAIAIALLWMRMKGIDESNKKLKESMRSAPVLLQDVKSGETLKSEMFGYKEISNSSIPLGEGIVFSLPLFNENGEEVEDEYVAKIDLKANTVVTSDMVTKSDEKTTNDIRQESYNMISLPVDLNTDDYIDIRFMLPDGTDYIVLSKKKVEIPTDTGVPSADTIKLNMSEKDLLTMSSAIVEAYRIKGSKLYAIKYVEAGNQEAATVTYKPREDIVTMIKTDPNIVDRASAAIYNELSTKYRDGKINSYYNNGDSEDVVTGIEESTQKKQQDRQNYLSTLYGAEY